jgi:hypothetical protein
MPDLRGTAEDSKGIDVKSVVRSVVTIKKTAVSY